MAFFIYDVEMAISWGVFGAMYISMSDIGEGDMSKKTGTTHFISTGEFLDMQGHPLA